MISVLEKTKSLRSGEESEWEIWGNHVGIGTLGARQTDQHKAGKSTYIA